jgi:hypothetical protein
MKRSEMIRYIHNTIVDSSALQYGEWLRLSKQILDTIEEVGMLPPNDVYTNSDDDFLLEHYNKWEKEL